MKHIVYTLALLLGASGMTVTAATPDQMEQARVVAIKACLRDLNDGSDYLDKLNPTSLAELEKNLKTKEQENIKKLKGIKLPSQEEYGSWGSNEFTKYWSKDFVKKAGAKTPSFTGSKIEESVKGINVTKATPADDNQQAAQAPSQTGKDTLPPATAVATPEAAAIVSATTDPVPTEEVKPAPAPDKKDSSNTASIVILCILVLVVVALVGYALNVMKKNKIRQGEAMRRSRRREEDYEDYGRYDTPTVQSDPEEESVFAVYSGYQEPVRQRPAADPRDLEIERLRAEIAALQKKLGTAGRQPSSEITPAQRTVRHRVIYLAQANADGVFTRADAQFNRGISIFKLVTTDGVSGSYSVIEERSVFEAALMMPEDLLIDACEGRNLQLSEGARIIINEASGTAIFEDGRWRVSRKARIRYSR